MGEILAEKWHGLWWRVPLCCLFLFGAAWLFLSGLEKGGMLAVYGTVVLATACLILAAMTMAPVLAHWVAHNVFGSLAGLFFPERTFRRVPPAYGPAESRRMEGRPTKALEAYEAILVEYPDDGRCYLAMMDTAWQDMQNAALANGFYRRARAVVKDEEYLAEMRQAYDDFAPYLSDRIRAPEIRDQGSDGATPGGTRPE